MTVAAGLDVRRYADADEASVLSLLGASLQGGPTGERTPEFFHWKHRDNPFGPSFALVAESAGRVVGFRTFLRWEFRAAGETVRAVRAVDTATHPDFQGRGIFRDLTLRALDELGDTVDLVYNTPNGQSLPGYLKMGWSAVGDVPIAIRPIHPWRLLRGLRHVDGGGVAQPSQPCPFPPASSVFADPRLPDLVAESAGELECRFATVRSVPFLAWRYGAAPGLDYRVILDERGGELRGVAFGRPRGRGALSEFTLADVVVRPGDTAAARRLLGRAARAGGDHVATHCAAGTESRRAAWRAGYLGVPGRGMTLVANPRTPLTPDPTRLTSWRFALGDLEVF